MDPILVLTSDPTLNMASTFNLQNILILRYRDRKIAVSRDQCHNLEVSVRKVYPHSYKSNCVWIGPDILRTTQFRVFAGNFS
jgi:hypothetical protein